MTAWSGALCVAGVLTALPASAQAPPVPSLPLSEYPSEARAAVEPAYQAALARPSDAAAVGALARILQAWQELDAAHQAYRRAQVLAPKIFDWWYLDGIVLPRLARHEDAGKRARLSF